MVLCTCTMCYFTTSWIGFLDAELVDHMSAWMVQEIVDHFARQGGGGEGLWGR